MSIKKSDPLLALMKGSASYGLATGDFSTRSAQQEKQVSASTPAINWRPAGLVSAMWNYSRTAANPAPTQTAAQALASRSTAVETRKPVVASVKQHPAATQQAAMKQPTVKQVAVAQRTTPAASNAEAEKIRQAIVKYGFVMSAGLRDQILASLDAKPDAARETAILKALEPLKVGSYGPYAGPAIASLQSFYEGRRG